MGTWAICVIATYALHARPKQELTKDHIRTFLDSEGIDELGFTPHQRLYLRILAAMPKGLCSVERLAIKLGCDTLNVRHDVEMYLIEQGYVDSASHLGRGITQSGLELVQGFHQDVDDCKDPENDDDPSR